MSDDLIRRSDAIKSLDNAWINGTSLLDANEAVKQLNDLPSADRPTGWAPVSEALPIKGQVVLDIDDKETWGDKGTWDVDKQRGW